MPNVAAEKNNLQQQQNSSDEKCARTTKCARKDNLTNEWKYEGKKPVAKDENVVIAEEEKENMQRFFYSSRVAVIVVSVMYTAELCCMTKLNFFRWENKNLMTLIRHTETKMTKPPKKYCFFIYFGLSCE